MHRLQMRPGHSVGCGALIFLILLILLASHVSAFAQGAAAPAAPAADAAGPRDCPAPAGGPATQSATDAAVTLSPARGWQMVGREIELTITSSKLKDTKPVVCFRWKLVSGEGKFVQAASVRIVQRSPADQQPQRLTVAAPVPLLANWPLRGQGRPQDLAVYTEDDPIAPMADVRILLLGADDKPVEELTTSFAVVGSTDYCNVPRTGRTDIGTVSTSKNWQPAHGQIQFTATTFTPLPNDILIRTCFRWTLSKGGSDIFSDSENNRVLDRQSTTVKVAVTVPDIGNQPARFSGERVGDYGFLFLMVPKLDVRMLFFNSANLDLVLDAWTSAWTTHILFGVVAAILVVGAAFIALWLVCHRRFTSLGKTNPILCLIMTRNGFASLSQFQIMLWTFLVIASAAYVMALSGTLIPITTGTLVLLGISGGAVVVAKVKSESGATAAPPPIDTAAAAKEAARAEDDARNAQKAVSLAVGDEKADAVAAAKEWEAKAKAAKASAEAVEARVAAANARAAVATAADKAKAEADAQAAEALAEEKRKDADKAAADAAVATRVRHPLWSDLVMEEIKGRELDVTRVQMLYFTLVTAAFVALKVITSYEIPDIPEGYLVLMGISNSVYLGSKLATNPAAKS